MQRICSTHTGLALAFSFSCVTSGPPVAYLKWGEERQQPEEVNLLLFSLYLSPGGVLVTSRTEESLLSVHTLRGPLLQATLQDSLPFVLSDFHLFCSYRR